MIFYNFHWELVKCSIIIILCCYGERGIDHNWSEAEAGQATFTADRFCCDHPLIMISLKLSIKIQILCHRVRNPAQDLLLQGMLHLLQICYRENHSLGTMPKRIFRPSFSRLQLANSNKAKVISILPVTKYRGWCISLIKHSLCATTYTHTASLSAAFAMFYLCFSLIYRVVQVAGGKKQFTGGIVVVIIIIITWMEHYSDFYPCCCCCFANKKWKHKHRDKYFGVEVEGKASETNHWRCESGNRKGIK